MNMEFEQYTLFSVLADLLVSSKSAEEMTLYSL